MRVAIAIPFLILFVIIFTVTLVISRVVNTAGDPSEISGVIEDADLYDFVYDRALDAALTDLTTKGITVGSGDSGLSGEKKIEFEDPARAHVALKEFIEAVAPREYVKEKVDETLNGVIPYASGRTDSFQVDLETSERIDALPEAVRDAATALAIGELIVSDLLVPTVRELSDSITDEALGIRLTPEEAEDATRRILPPEWIEDQLFSVVDQAAPYFAGTQDELDIRVVFKDRVPIAGQVLKEKLADEDTLTNLVFEQVVDPLLASFAVNNNVSVFGIEITENDLQEAIEIVAPADWVQAQGDGVIDAVVAWLVGATDELEYTFELTERRAEAADQLDDLALRKLDDQIASTPICATPTQAGLALDNALSGQFPSCLPANSSEILDVMRPTISNEVRNFVLLNVPDQITYSEAGLRAQLGSDSLESLDDLREIVLEGFSFTDEDLVNGLGGDGDAQSAADVRETLDFIRAGFVFDQTEITGRMDEAQLSQFNEIREYVALGWNFRWLVFLPALVLLAFVAVIGGRGWQGRAKWAGAPVAIVAIMFFATIQVGWASTASLREISIPEDALSAETRAEFPALANLVYGGELQSMVERVGSSWISSLAMSAVPWAVAGIALFAIGYFYPRYRENLPSSLGGPAGPGGPSSTDPDSRRDAPLPEYVFPPDPDEVPEADDDSARKPDEAA